MFPRPVAVFTNSLQALISVSVLEAPVAINTTNYRPKLLHARVGLYSLHNTSEAMFNTQPEYVHV